MNYYDAILGCAMFVVQIVNAGVWSVMCGADVWHLLHPSTIRSQFTPHYLLDATIDDRAQRLHTTLVKP